MHFIIAVLATHKGRIHMVVKISPVTIGREVTHAFPKKSI